MMVRLEEVALLAEGMALSAGIMRTSIATNNDEPSDCLNQCFTATGKSRRVAPSGKIVVVAPFLCGGRGVGRL